MNKISIKFQQSRQRSMLCSFVFVSAFFLNPAFAALVSISTITITINFTASNLQFIDTSGAFLASEHNTFQARITNLKPESTSFYFVIIHVASKTIVWSANRNHPISGSSQLRLTAGGLTIYNDTRFPIWSTSLSRSSVSSLQLLESGNLVLIDARKNVLWQSFDSPTDVLVAEQKLNVGKWLVASSSYGEISEGSYRFLIGVDDAMLQWNGLNYWKLSMDGNAFRDKSNFPVEFLKANVTGVFLMGGNGEEVVIKGLNTNTNTSNPWDFVFLKLDNTGLLSVVSNSSLISLFEGPDDKCQIPIICGNLGVCTKCGDDLGTKCGDIGERTRGASCSCTPEFRQINGVGGDDCVPNDISLDLPDSSCDNTVDSKYLSLVEGLDYIAGGFKDPVISGVNDSFCKNLCSRNCSCLGVVYSQSSRSCYLIKNYLVSLQMGLLSDHVGYVKVVAVGTPNSKDSSFPTVAVLFPLIGVVLLISMAAAAIYLRRWKSSYSSTDEEDLVSIPGMPVRFEYKELAEATEDFKTQIGSGGFGTVYKGILRDRSEVAVKKITCLGAQGKREFLTEIAAIGKIRHSNLVKLKGFYAHGEQRLLVYEFMKRGSLDRTLFQGEPVLEWKERFEIALGVARGLAYLHCGCDHKIIHCDVKPENILLNDKLEARVADFGLSKLLTREQSGFYTTMRGTRGYVAPEWLTNTAISDKIDVYSYGMVLLEIISGMKNFYLQHSSAADECLVNFPLRALEMHVEKRYTELVDPRLNGNALSEEVEKLVHVALCCLHRDPVLRPTMSNVVRMLEGGMAPCKPRMDSLNFLRFYGQGALAEGNEQNELALNRQEMSYASNLDNSFSHISSHQVSGPR